MITSGYNHSYKNNIRISNNTPPSVQKPTINNSEEHVHKQESNEPIEESKQADTQTDNFDYKDEKDDLLRGGSEKRSIKSAPSVKTRGSKDMIQIRDFPRNVMDIVRGVVPGGNSYVETLLAYIYVTSPTKFDIPPSVQAIVEDYMQEDPLSQVFKEIRLLREQMKNIEVSTYQSVLASEYTLFNDLGFRHEDVSHPSDINYLETGVEDMHIALENGAKQLKKKDTIRHGRR